MKAMMKTRRLHKRANTEIWLYDDPVHGDCIYKEIYHQPQLTTAGVSRSYEIYESLVDKEDLVKVHNVVTLKDTVCVVMENLRDWARIDRSHYRSMFKIIQRLAAQGVIDWDYSPTNFLVSPEGVVKMIDLDRLVRISSLPETPPSEHWILTWFGSRVVKFLKEME